MIQLFAILFFALVLGISVAAIWAVVDEHRDLVLANLPWRARSRTYCATPSSRSETPIRAITVSPASVR